MRTSTWALPLALLLASGCDQETLDTCLSGGVAPTCENACANLFDIGCQIGRSREECVATCTETTAAASAEYRAVLGCYGAASSCAEVDGCAMVCGPGGGPVAFVGHDAGAACTDDALEPNDGTSSAKEVALPSETSASLCEGSPDLFWVDATAGTTVTATATFASGFADVTILGSDGAPLTASGEGASPRAASHTAGVDGVLFVRVSTTTGDVGSYVLSLTTAP